MINYTFSLLKPAALTLCLASIFTISHPLLLFGTEVTNGTDQTSKADAISEETVLAKHQKWAAFPIISSSPETGLMLGGMFFYFLPTEEREQQASTFDIMAFGTTEGQYAFSFTPNVFSTNRLFRLNTSFYINYWEANYYQIGNDSPEVHEEYDSRNHGTILTLEGRVYDSFILNFVCHYEKTDMDIIAGGMLSSSNINGAKDGEYIGVGLALGYDSRDNTNAPAKGMLTRYEYATYDEEIGSSLDFQIQTLDLRYYTKTTYIKDSVIALAAQIKSSDGEVPFRYLSTPDGTIILRGIELGRYKDNDMLALQAEYRFPIKWKFSGSVFTEFAQVANDFGDMELKETKTSIGCGIRYALNPDQRLNIRGDIAWVDDGIGMIINVREAF